MRPLLRAKVRRATGNARYYVGAVRDGELIHHDREMPLPATVEIHEEAEDSYYLLHFDEAGTCIANDFAFGLGSIKEQARFAFAIQDEDWEPIGRDD